MTGGIAPSAAGLPSRLRGIAFICLAVLFFTILDTAAKYAGRSVPTVEVAWARYAINLLLTVVILRPWAFPAAYWTGRPIAQTIRALFLLASTVFNFAALHYLQLAETVSITFAAPLLVTAAAGEEWDFFVKQCVARGLAGIECLSGIPGLVGATPIQNVGAYGQEVQDTIVSVKALDRTTGEPEEFANADCKFGYRQSRFKSSDVDSYVITEVTFRLRKSGRPEIRYPELRRSIDLTIELDSLSDGEPVLQAVRDAVLNLRRNKSMVVDPNDPNSRSVGSFFMNPLLTSEELEILRARWLAAGRTDPLPTFPSNGMTKVPAAWLVEQSGFRKGFRAGGVGISQNHSLALVNYSGSSKELMNLASRVEHAVSEKFGIILQREPVVVPT